MGEKWPKESGSNDRLTANAEYCDTVAEPDRKSSETADQPAGGRRATANRRRVRGHTTRQRSRQTYRHHACGNIAAHRCTSPACRAACNARCKPDSSPHSSSTHGSSPQSSATAMAFLSTTDRWHLEKNATQMPAIASDIVAPYLTCQGGRGSSQRRQGRCNGCWRWRRGQAPPVAQGREREKTATVR